jgi:hypothetical protein
LTDPVTIPVGAAEGCDLLIFKEQDQKIAAFGSSYRDLRLPGAFGGWPQMPGLAGCAANHDNL